MLCTKSLKYHAWTQSLKKSYLQWSMILPPKRSAWKTKLFTVLCTVLGKVGNESIHHSSYCFLKLFWPTLVNIFNIIGFSFDQRGYWSSLHVSFTGSENITCMNTEMTSNKVLKMLEENVNYQTMEYANKTLISERATQVLSTITSSCILSNNNCAF